MDINIKDIEKLVQLIQNTGVTELTITQDKASISLKQEKTVVTQVAVQTAPVITNANAVAPQIQATATETPKVLPPKGHAVKSPMVGTLYLAPSPGAAAFVKVGQTVKAGDPLCIIEAMKMMNRIEADKAGTVAAILVADGSPVEFDQPLIMIE
jgi:acetyl-CoA carboxylase biotin carboxyl carrier protein